MSNLTTVIPYPASNASPLTLTYRIMGETATATVTYPTDPLCNQGTTTTSEVTSIHHDDPAHREYNDNLLPLHYDHLVPWYYDDEYLYDPVHHYLFDRPTDVPVRGGADGVCP